jgi:hypothetical protein
LTSNELVRYIEALTELEPSLSPSEKSDLERYQQSAQFDGDSRWPGWVKYLGPRPETQRPTLGMMRRSA